MTQEYFLVIIEDRDGSENYWGHVMHGETPPLIWRCLMDDNVKYLLRSPRTEEETNFTMKILMGIQMKRSVIFVHGFMTNLHMDQKWQKVDLNISHSSIRRYFHRCAPYGRKFFPVS